MQGVAQSLQLIAMEAVARVGEQMKESNGERNPEQHKVGAPSPGMARRQIYSRFG
jgi:hypothetical protein